MHWRPDLTESFGFCGGDLSPKKAEATGIYEKPAFEI